MISYIYMNPYTNISKAGTGAYALIVSLLLFGAEKLGVPLTETDALQLVQSVMAIYGIVMSIYGTMERSDLKAGLIRK